MAVMNLSNVQHFSPEFLANAGQVYTLNLSRYSQLSRSKDIIAFQNLIQLNISFCELSSFPLDVTELRELKAIDASNNAITKLPYQIGNFLSLEYFNLSRNEIRELPDDIGKLVSLKNLDLTNNALSQLPRSIGNLRNLKNLDLTNNALSQLPNSIGNLRNLEVLNLFQNRIVVLPDTMENLTQLKYFNVGKNLLGLPCHLSTTSSSSIRMSLRIKMVPVDLCSNEVLKEYILPAMVAFRSLVTRLTNLEYLDIRACDWFDFPEDFRDLSKLEHLILNGNQLECVPPTLFELRNLSFLSLRRCALTVVPEDIKMLCKLSSLDLSKNQLTSLPPTLGDLERLESLIISENPLRTFPTSIASVSSLKVLHMEYCGLSDIPEDISKLSKLETLVVSLNPLRDFPSAVVMLTSLVTLDMRQCGLHELSPDIRHMKKLEVLDVSYNLLVSLPECIGDLMQLNRLAASGNPLAKLPETIGNLTKLSVLELGSKRISMNVNPTQLPVFQAQVTRLYISRLPEVIGNLLMLTNLFLVGNNLMRLPTQIGDLVNLLVLDISHNKIRELPSSVGQLQRLKSLNMAYNSLSSLPETFGGLKMLETLDMRGNSLLQRLPSSICSLTCLKSLSVAGCLVSKDLCKFERLTNLTHIDIGHIALMKEVPTFLQKILHLRLLNLSWCGLESLPLQLEGLKFIEILDISGNKGIQSFPTVITQMNNLRQLGIACCGISDLPCSIEKLQLLQSIYAGNNRFDHFPSILLHMKSISAVDFSNMLLGPDIHRNRITELPSDLIDFPNPLMILNVTGNAMKKPPMEICAQGLIAIKQYMWAFQLGGELFCENSISMLGDPASGKSSLVLSLKEGKPCRTKEADRTCVLQQDKVQLGDYYVNVNDFGGHPIYHAVLPMFLSRQGIGILAYDMSDQREIQEAKVRKWLCTAISKSPAMHLIVVGTHADLVGSDSELAEATRHMEAFVKNTVDCIKTNLKMLLCHRENKSVIEFSNMNGNRFSPQESEEVKGDDRHADSSTTTTWEKYEKYAEDMFQSLSQASQVVLSISCQKELKGSEIKKLENAILQKLKPGNQMPVKWVTFMKKFLNNSDPDQSIYITRENATALFQSVVGGGDTALNTVLEYLVSTSRIIWIKDHSKLSNVIFHRIDIILDVCRQLLHHQPPCVTELLESHLEYYKQGILTEQFMNFLLDSHQKNAKVIKEFVIACNIMCQACKNDGTFMVIPSLLPDEDSEYSLYLHDEEDAVRHFRPIVHICINFFEAHLMVIPLALFETSLVSLLSDIKTSGKAEPTVWRNGMSYVANSLRVRYERFENKVDLKAIALPGCNFHDLWEELHWFLHLVTEYVFQKWPGGLPKVTFMCPTGIYFASRDAPHGRIATLKDLQTDEEPPVLKFHCKTCKRAIPPSFLFKCQPAHLGPERMKIAEDFLESLRKFKDSPEAEQEIRAAAKLKDKLKTLRPDLVNSLTKVDVENIIDQLISHDHLTNEDREIIENKPTSTAMARSLLDILGKKSDEAVRDFVAALSPSTSREKTSLIKSDPLSENSSSSFH